MTIRHPEFQQIQFKNPTVKVIERILDDPNINQKFKDSLIDQMRKHDYRE